MTHLDAPPAPTGEAAPSSTDAGVTPPAPAAAPAADPPSSPARRSGRAVAGFVVGLVALLVSAIPVLNLVSVVGGVVAVVLAVVALRRLDAGVPGKGFAVAGLVLGVVSVILAVVVSVAMAVAVERAVASGELDAVLAQAGNAQAGGSRDVVAADGAADGDATVATAESAADPTAGDGTADDTDDPATVVPATGDPAAAAAPREDFSHLDCDTLVVEAVAMSKDYPGADLTEIWEAVVVEDHRVDHAAPAGADHSLVLSCRGRGVWADGLESPVLMELTIDAAGELYVGYAGE